MSRYTASTHAGTHADAPLHDDPDGAAIDDVLLETYVSPARLLDLRGRGPVITPDMVAAALPGPTRLLFRTYDRFPHHAWTEAFVTLLPDRVALLAAHGARLIGIDPPSIDPQHAKTLPAHDAARVAGLHLLEGLVRDDVAAGDYELIALPVRPGGLDAAPVRAVLRSLA